MCTYERVGVCGCVWGGVGGGAGYAHMCMTAAVNGHMPVVVMPNK